jgi:hypothetical protein
MFGRRRRRRLHCHLRHRSGRGLGISFAIHHAQPYCAKLSIRVAPPTTLSNASAMVGMMSTGGGGSSGGSSSVGESSGSGCGGSIGNGNGEGLDAQDTLLAAQMATNKDSAASKVSFLGVGKWVG